MTVQMELGPALAMLGSLLVAIVAAFWVLVKMLLEESKQHINQKFEDVAKGQQNNNARTERIERELLELKAELPRDYVRREDNNRVIGSLQVSIENLRLGIERALDRRGDGK